MSIAHFPEILSQRILLGIILGEIGHICKPSRLSEAANLGVHLGEGTVD